jgi:hypothetical protein
LARFSVDSCIIFLSFASFSSLSETVELAFEPRLCSSSSSSSDNSSAKDQPDGSLEKDIFNTIKKQNSFSSTTFPTEDLTPTINPIELDLTPPKPPTPTNETTKNIFDSSDEENENDEEENEKPKEEEETKEIHSMLDMWNKKYDVGTPTTITTPEPVSIPPPTTVNLIDIDINHTVDDEVGCTPEPLKLDAPTLEPPTIEPLTPTTPAKEKTEEKPEVKSETSGMNWDLSSSDDDSNEEKTQISNQKEKIMTTAKMINLDSTDDEAGLTELDTDVEASSVIPDASESTIADNDDRADFLAQTTSGYIPAPQVIFENFVIVGKLVFAITSRVIRILMEHIVKKIAQNLNYKSSLSSLIKFPLF